VAAIADGNAELTRLLLAEAVDPEGPDAVAELRAALESALGSHEDDAAEEAERDYGEWYPDFEGAETLIEEAGTYLEDAVPPEYSILQPTCAFPAAGRW